MNQNKTLSFKSSDFDGAGNHFESELIHFALTTSFNDLPKPVVEQAKYILTDSLAVGIAGSGFELSQGLKSALGINQKIQLTLGCDQLARVWGSGERVPVSLAAMINAYQIHNQEFDCLHEEAVVHPMAVILASLMAFSERSAVCSDINPVTGKEFLTALVVAVDCAVCLGLCAESPMRFFRPAVCGALGASLGLSRLAGLSAEQTRSALGLVYSQISGTMQAHLEGVSALPLQIAFNARASLDALSLVRQGFSGPVNSLSGRFGYLELYEGQWQQRRVDELISQLGLRWRIAELSIKPFPTGRAAHATLDGLACLKAQYHFTTDEIEKVCVFAPPLVRRLIDRPIKGELSANYAKLCLPFLIARFLLEGRINLADFKPTIAVDKPTLLLAEKVRILPIDCEDPNALIPQRLELKLMNGQCLSQTLDTVLGHPKRELNAEQRNQKLLDCAKRSQPTMSASQILELERTVAQLETHSNLKPLIDLLVVRQFATNETSKNENANNKNDFPMENA